MQLEAQQARGIAGARTIKAENAGIVTAVSAQAGQIASAGTPLVAVVPFDGVEAKLGVDPNDLANVHPGISVSLRLPGSTNSLAGTVRQVSHALNAQRLCDVFVKVNTRRLTTRNIRRRRFREMVQTVKRVDPSPR